MKKAWYKEGVVYQIYPRSFNDSNNDGIGDIPGIIEKLDYIASLGANIIWLSPIYASPLDDNGYDISDYKAIHPDYGTMDDFKTLLSECHKRGLKLIMDLVVNHTSDEHKWFIESRKSVDNPYRDYYIWRKPSKKGFPNNWKSFFGGDAWKLDEATNEYYLHLFSPKQPDLNWDNPKVREEVKDILRFWLDLGIDGFRCDVINIISKCEGLPNGKFDLLLTGKEKYLNGPNIFKYLGEIRDEVFSNYDMFTVGEGCFITTNDAINYESGDNPYLNMMFMFDHMNCDSILVKWFVKKFKPKNLKKAMRKWQYEVNGKGWNTLYFENHDQPRSISRFGSETHRIESGKMLATYLYFMQGTPFIYQGQEIGMTNPHYKKLEEYEDVESRNIYNIGRKSFGFSHKFMMKRIEIMSRDNARTMMQWDDSDNGGFSKVTPWYSVNSNYKEINVKKDLESNDSLIKYYQEIIKLRNKHEVIVYGDYKEYFPNSNKLACYTRTLGEESIMVLINFTNKNLKINLKKLPFDVKKGKEILNSINKKIDGTLLPYQAIVFHFPEKYEN